MLKKTLLSLSILILFLSSGCGETERTTSGKIVFFANGTQQNIFKHKLTFIAVFDKEKRLCCVAKKTDPKDNFGVGDVVEIRYNIYTIARTLQESEMMGKKYKGLIWKNLLSVKRT